MNKKRTLLICIIILLAGAGITTLVFMTEPKAKKGGATKQTAMLVDVIKVKKGNFSPTIRAMGTVRPSQDIVLSPRINGEVIRMSADFIPGGYLQKGEVILQIDPSDYKNMLQQRESELQQAIAELELEKGQQDVAVKDYELLGDTLSGENKELVLRKPQLEAARSGVDAAQAAVEQAKLQLQRTTLRAPFDAQVITRNVNVGSQVAPGNNLGRLVGVDHYWVMTTVQLANLRWLDFPDGEHEKGPEVKIRNRTAWPEGQYRSGYLYKQIGALEEQTRLARLLVNVPDPLAQNNKSTELPALTIGAFVEANIQAKEIENVVRLNRDYIRSNNTVWIMKDGELHIADVNIIMRDAQYAYVDSGLNDGDMVVTTSLSTVTEGAKLRLEDTTGVDTDGNNE